MPINNPTDLTALTATVDDIHQAIDHLSAVFPEDTDLTCTFTADAGADTWSAWAEILDSAGTTLSSFFAVIKGHITNLQIEIYSDVNALYMMEISWGADKTVVGRARFAATGKFTSADTTTLFHAPKIPVGETVYYRMKTNTSVADTVEVHIRHHTH